jgi:hypothetical protein
MAQQAAFTFLRGFAIPVIYVGVGAVLGKMYGDYENKSVPPKNDVHIVEKKPAELTSVEVMTLAKDPN